MKGRTPSLLLVGLLTLFPLRTAGFLDSADAMMSGFFDSALAPVTPSLGPAGKMPREAALDRLVDNTDRLLRSEGRPVRRERLDEIAKIAERAGLEYHLPPSLILSVIHTESRFRREAVSPDGAIGLMQVQLETARYFASVSGLRAPTAPSLLDPEANITLGTGYLRYLIDHFGDLRTALAAYNVGPTEIGRRRTAGRSFSERYGREICSREVYYTTSLPRGLRSAAPVEG